jgi:hypothetical protein
MPAHGELKGRQVNPRELAHWCYKAGWKDTHNLMTAVCICLAESQGFEKATNENRTDDGRVLSVDRGVFQINNKAHPWCSDAQAFDAEGCCRAGYRVWKNRGGSFNAWAAYSVLHEIRGVVMPAYLQDTYLRRAARGVGNYLAELFQNRAQELGYPSELPLPLLDYR